MDQRISLYVLGLSYSQLQSGAYALVLAEENGPRRIPVVIGASDRAEIWDAARWAADNEDLTSDQMAELMDSLNF